MTQVCHALLPSTQVDGMPDSFSASAKQLLQSPGLTEAMAVLPFVTYCHSLLPPGPTDGTGGANGAGISMGKLWVLNETYHAH
jgi:hypothetical protein